MTKAQITYDAARVKEAYEARRPDRAVVRVCKDRKTAMKLVAAKAGRMIDLSYGFYVVTDTPA